MADVALTSGGAVDAPLEYTIPGAQEIIPKAATASYDGTNAGGNYVPTLIVRAPNDAILAACPIGQTIAAGASADVSWFPRGGVSANGGRSGDYVTIFDLTLAAPAAGFTVAGIPQGFASLEIIASLRSTAAVVIDAVDMRFNNDSNTHYFWTNTFGNHGRGTTALPLMFALGTAAVASHFGYGRFTLPDYSLTATDHAFFGQTFFIEDESNTGTYLLGQWGGQRCTAPADTITSLEITLDSGSNFDTGSRFTVAGLN